MGGAALEHVSKHYDDITVVDDMNLGIDDGELICLIGPSGCGKLATVGMITGLTIPSGGEMFTGDRGVTNLLPKDRGVAMMFRNIALFPHMDVYDNISFRPRLCNYDKGEIGRRVERAAETVQLQGTLEYMPDEMSGGQRQHVTIIRAIVRNPDVFLMDEPLASLDARLRVHMRTGLQHLHKGLDTIITCVTHDQVETMTMSDRIAVIDSRQLQQIDPPLVCYNEPANLFVVGFIDSPSINFLNGEIVADGFPLTNIDAEFDPANLGVEPGTDITMGIRPEDVYLVDERSLVSNSSYRINAVTDVFEPIGDEIFVYLKLSESVETDLRDTSGVASNQLLMSVAPDTDITEDEDVTIVLDCPCVHLSNTAADEIISHSIETPVQTSGAPDTETESDD